MLDGGDRRMGGGMRGGSVGFNDGFEQVCYVIGHFFFSLEVPQVLNFMNKLFCSRYFQLSFFNR